MLRRWGAVLGCLGSIDADAGDEANDHWQPGRLRNLRGPTLPPPPPSPSKLPLAAGSLRAFQPPRSMDEALAALEAEQPLPPPSPARGGGLGGTAPADVCRAFAAGQHWRMVTPAQRRRERERVAREQQEHLETIGQITRALRVKGGPAVMGPADGLALPLGLAGWSPQQDAATTAPGAAHTWRPAPPAQEAFKLGPVFQTRAGSGAAATQLVPLHGMQLAARAQAAAEAATAAAAAAIGTRVSPAAAAAAAPAVGTCPAAAPARPASSPSSVVHSASSQLVQLGSGGSMGSAAGSPCCGSSLWADKPESRSPATGAAASPAVQGVNGSVLIELAVLGAAEASGDAGGGWQDGLRECRASSTSAKLPAQPSESFVAFVRGVQQMEEGRVGGSDASSTAASRLRPEPAQAQAAGVDSSQLEGAEQSSLHAFGSQQALLPPQSDDGFSIPAAHGISCVESGSSSSGRRRLPQAPALLGHWRQVLHSLRLTRGGAAGRQQEQGGARWAGRQRQGGGLAQTAEDVRPKQGAYRGAHAPAASRTSGDENQPILR